jgi:hypothetical protein
VPLEALPAADAVVVGLFPREFGALPAIWQGKWPVRGAELQLHPVLALRVLHWVAQGEGHGRHGQCGQLKLAHLKFVSKFLRVNSSFQTDGVWLFFSFFRVYLLTQIPHKIDVIMLKMKNLYI